MKITENDQCVGCGACVNICPAGAIAMKPDAEGFLHPDIQQDQCIACGLCRKVCPAETPMLQPGQKRAYAVKHNIASVREKSTSGGAFIAFSDWILSKHGVIYGVVYDEGFRAVHVRTDSAAGRDRMCGSKYVQSDTGDTYRMAAEDLCRGRWVLFSGTSCQIDGLNHYLSVKKISTERLLTCSLICHGVPSPMMWQEHLSNIRRRRGKEIAHYAHRSKIRGWHEHNECITYTDGSREYYSKLSQNHKDLFYGHFIIRPSCSQCRYAADPSASDLTIADFWGIQHLMPRIDDNRGVSLVIANSEKGQAALEACRDITLWNVDTVQALAHNHTKPCKPHPQRAQFWSDYHAHGYAYVCAKYVHDSIPGRMYYGGKKRLRSLLVRLGLKPV